MERIDIDTKEKCRVGEPSPNWSRSSSIVIVGAESDASAGSEVSEAEQAPVVGSGAAWC